MSSDDPEDVEVPANNTAQAQPMEDSGKEAEGVESDNQIGPSDALGFNEPPEEAEQANAKVELPTDVEEEQQGEIPADEDIPESVEDHALDQAQPAETNEAAQEAIPAETAENEPDKEEEIPVSVDPVQEDETVDREELKNQTSQAPDEAQAIELADAAEDLPREESQEIPEPADNLNAAQESDNRDALQPDQSDRGEQAEKLEEDNNAEQMAESQSIPPSETLESAEITDDLAAPEEGQTPEQNLQVEDTPDDDANAASKSELVDESQQVGVAPVAEEADSAQLNDDSLDSENAQNLDEPEENDPELAEVVAADPEVDQLEKSERDEQFLQSEVAEPSTDAQQAQVLEHDEPAEAETEKSERIQAEAEQPVQPPQGEEPEQLQEQDEIPERVDHDQRERPEKDETVQGAEAPVELKRSEEILHAPSPVEDRNASERADDTGTAGREAEIAPEDNNRVEENQNGADRLDREDQPQVPESESSSEAERAGEEAERIEQAEQPVEDQLLPEKKEREQTWPSPQEREVASERSSPEDASAQLEKTDAFDHAQTPENVPEKAEEFTAAEKVAKADQLPSSLVGSERREESERWNDMEKEETAAVAEGGERFARYAQEAFKEAFAETPAILRLWENAKVDSEGKERANSRAGFDAARDKFWDLVRDPENKDGQVVQKILKEAGFAFGDGRAPALVAEIKPTDPEKAVKFTKQEIVQRLEAHKKKPMNDERREYRLGVSLALDIDHANPASLSHQWLDPQNLQFMFGDDNRFHKGNRYGADGKRIPKS